jgi:hypothetical protein
MYDSFMSIPFLQKWFYNLIHDIKNEEILLLIYPQKQNKDVGTENLNIINKINLKIRSLEHNGSYNILNLESIFSINQILNNKNTILVSNVHIDINKLENCKNTILYFNVNNEIHKTIFTLNKTLNLYNNELYEQDYRSNYIKLMNPINILRRESSIIYNLIFRLFENNNFYNIELLKSNKSIDTRTWIEQINEEIYVLTFHNILTSKLAIAIYKICTFNFHENNKNIGIFYSKQLGIKSKTMHLPNIHKNKIEMLSIKAKAYDLKNSKVVDNSTYLYRKSLTDKKTNY